MMGNIRLNQYDLIAIVFTLAQASCGYDKNQVEHDLHYLHCCDFNEPLYKLVNQINVDDIDGKEEKEYIMKLQEKSKLDYEEEEE